MKTDNSSAIALILITSVISCGLMIPFWLLIGLVYVAVLIFSPPKPQPEKKPEVIKPSNEFASDW